MTVVDRKDDLTLRSDLDWVSWWVQMSEDITHMTDSLFGLGRELSELSFCPQLPVLDGTLIHFVFKSSYVCPPLVCLNLVQQLSGQPIAIATAC